MVRHQEVGTAVIRVFFHEPFQVAELAQIGVLVRIQTSHGLLVPAGPRGQNGVQSRCCLFIFLLSKKRQGSELMKRGVAGK